MDCSTARSDTVSRPTRKKPANCTARGDGYARAERPGVIALRRNRRLIIASVR
jgi:hypothetical protein